MQDEQIFSVSGITELVKICLEETFKNVCVEGEISNYRPSSSGHLYCTLKDQNAAISLVMFKNRLRSLDFVPADGCKVRVYGSLSVYAQRGNYQLIAETMEEAGQGEILERLEKLKKKLAAEGLFDEDKKKKIPQLPSSLAVISSGSGAALRDILNVLKRRAPGIQVTILPSLVQGEDAAAQICARIRQANHWKLGEVIILGRGGGSLEDLLAFSDEQLVREVAASELPIISAVGHETDWSLCDFASDLRAPTPSAAAELVSAQHEETLETVRQSASQLLRDMRAKTERCRLLLKPFSSKEMEYRFRSLLQPSLVRFDDAKEDLCDAMRERLDEARTRLRLIRTGMEAASPLAVLERGFSVVSFAQSGELLRDASSAKIGDKLVIRAHRGSVETVVEQIHGQN